MDIIIVPLLKDNYSYILRCPNTNVTACIDPGEASPILDILNNNNWNLNFILNTHHHWDHVNGNLKLKEKTGAKIVASFYDKERIPLIDVTLKDNEEFLLGNIKSNIIYIPGHTMGHIAYFFKNEKALFCGDTLFSLGCGRIFEGTSTLLYNSLQRLAKLPLDTKIYCGHEYTIDNGKFALTIEPKNQDLKDYISKCELLRSKGKPTIPSTIADELRCNPFLRIKNNEDREYNFAKLREEKNNFKS